MRDLKFSDVFTVLKILKKAGIAEQAKQIFSEDRTNVSEKEIGAKFIFMLLENLGNVEDEVAEFLGDLKEMTKEEIKNMTLDETALAIQELIQHEGFKNFLSSVSVLTK